MGSHLFSHQQQFPHVEQQQQTWHQQAHAQAQAAQAAQQARYHLSNNHNQAHNHGATMANSTHGQDSEGVTEENRKILVYVSDLLRDDARESALLELSKKREQVPELALILWHSFGRSSECAYTEIQNILNSFPPGVMTSLLQEIISVYTLLNPSQLTAAASNRVCNALALLQCVASHNETRALFLNGTILKVLIDNAHRSNLGVAHIPLFLYPFLNTTSKSRPFEYLRLTSLGVIGALVKNDSSDVINFLLTTEIIPLCLRIMETGSELSKTVAIFIVQKILLDDHGLNYICATYERFYAVGTVLSNMVSQLVEQQTARLLKHVVRCFLR